MTEAPPRQYYDGSDRYEKAKQAAEKTEGNLFKDKANWQFVAGVLSLCMLLCIVLVAFFASRAAYEPIYVVKNEEGQFRVLAWDQYKPTDADIKGDLMRWLRCYREIHTSRLIYERCWQLVPMFLPKKSQAFARVQAYADEVQPGKSLWEKSIEVRTDLNGFKHPDGRWQLDWTEDTYQLHPSGGQGKLLSTERRSAQLFVVRRKPTEKKQIELYHEPVNPFGIYITHFAVSE